jgi:hypothetical protein
MDLQSDFRELLESFNAHEVEFLVVGGFALAFHGAPRFTGDLDLLVRPDAANARKVLTALVAFGFGDVGLTLDEAFQSRTPGELGGVAVSFIGRDQFVTNKRSTGRTRDLADLEALGEQ